MADANTEISLGDLHTAIVTDIAAGFPGIVTVEFYREEGDRKTLPASALPACLLQLSEWENVPDIDPGTEQLAAQMRFEARLVLGFRTPEAKLSIRELAAALSAWLRKRRFRDPNNSARALPTGPAEVIGAYPDDFSPELDQYEVWRVEWTQVVHLGETVWKGGDPTPQHVLFSYSPAIGVPHESEYKELEN